MSFERPCCYSQHRPRRLCLSIRVLVHTLYFVEESYQLNKSSKADRQEERTTDHTVRYNTWILQICDIQINQHMDTIHSEMLLVSLTQMTVHGVCMYVSYSYRALQIGVLLSIVCVLLLGLQFGELTQVGIFAVKQRCALVSMCFWISVCDTEQHLRMHTMLHMLQELVKLVRIEK